MRKLYFILLALLLSCQIEDSNAPSPTDSFIKYFGELASQEVKDLEPIYSADGSTIDGFVIFGTQQFADSSSDFYLVRTDADGNRIGTSSLGISGFLFGDIDGDGDEDSDDFIQTEESAGQVEVLADGGFLTAGASRLANSTVGIDFSFTTLGIFDANLEQDPLFTILGDTVNLTRDLIINDVIVLSDGTIFLAGTQENAAETDLDFYFARLDPSLQLIWENNNASLVGTDDVAVRAFENDDGSIAVFGYSEDPGENGEQGLNVKFIEFNVNGNIQNSNAHGVLEPSNTLVIYDEILHDVIRIPGGFAAVGTSTVVNNQTFGFFMKINNGGLLRFSDTLTSEFSQDGTIATQLQTNAFGITATNTNDFIIVGEYVNFRTPDQSRGGEAMFFRVDPDGDKLFGFETNFGVGTGNDAAVDAITLPDGKIMVAATTDFGGGVQLFSLIKLNDSGELDN